LETLRARHTPQIRTTIQANGSRPSAPALMPFVQHAPGHTIIHFLIDLPMSLLYRVIARKNPRKPDEAPKYHAEAVSRGVIDMEQLLDAMCEDNTLNRDEARMGLNRMFHKSREFLKLGFNVHLGDLGYMRLTTRSKGVDKPEEVTAAAVTDIAPHFVFGKTLRSDIKNISLEREATK
jgi:predicted histone-like DNA-binding protein